MMNTEIFKSLTVEQFALLGMRDVAYVKDVRVEGQAAYAIHSADGNAVAVLANRDVAFATVRQNELEPVSVH
ncbi:MAG: DUF1150 family protein [Rhodospirillaceae bacterium]|jgi:hypothetical protein|nr:DUF1150 family protein [Rhodospirillaceae bacterium]MBT6116325.1 DUF1150 family protein [Rhodospirillaceae bacterium]